jgi:hypothetical protein
VAVVKTSWVLLLAQNQTRDDESVIVLNGWFLYVTRLNIITSQVWHTEEWNINGTVRFFYFSPELVSFVAEKAFIRRDIQWQLWCLLYRHRVTLLWQVVTLHTYIRGTLDRDVCWDAGRRWCWSCQLHLPPRICSVSFILAYRRLCVL